MIIMTGLFIAIKDNGFLALSSIAARSVFCIYACDIRCLCYAMTHLLYRSITRGHFWSLIIPKCLLMQVSISKLRFSISKVTTDSLTGVMNDAI